MARSTRKSTSPQITDPYAPLEQLVHRVLRRYGEFSPSTVEGESILLFLDYANAVIDDLHKHPYWPLGQSIAYYTHITDTRAIPDHVVASGLLARYAIDQGSKKSSTYLSEYHDRLNTLLLTQKFGVGAEFSIQAPDVKGGGAS